MEPLVSVNESASKALALEAKSGAFGEVKKEENVLTMLVACAPLIHV